MKLHELKSITEVAQLNAHLEGEFEKCIYTAALRNFCDMENPIRFNNFAFVIRELLTQVVDRLAPDRDVKLAKWYVKESDKYEVTRKQMLKFCAQGYFVNSTLPDGAQENINEFIKEYSNLYQKLNQYTHISEKYKGLDHK
ncbi:MAG: pPIWI-associating nuclease domain-containing protein [Methylobacter sp.]